MGKGRGKRREEREAFPHLVLLEVLLREVLEVALGEGILRGNHDLGLVLPHSHGIAEGPSLAVDLDALLEELLKVAHIKDAVSLGGGAVEHKLVRRLLALLPRLTLGCTLLLRSRGPRSVTCFKIFAERGRKEEKWNEWPTFFPAAQPQLRARSAASPFRTGSPPRQGTTFSALRHSNEGRMLLPGTRTP